MTHPISERRDTHHPRLIAEVLTTGDELLSGEWRDRNSHAVAELLREHSNVSMRRFTTIGDNLDQLIATIHEISERADLCVMTGGLGPTEDDLTLEALAAAAHAELTLDEALWDEIKTRFPKLERAAEQNRRQARVIAGSEVLRNEVGTAPGVQIKINRCVFFAFPGVPHELARNLTDHLEPWLAPLQTDIPHEHQRVVRVALIGESTVAKRIAALELPPSVKIGYQALHTEHRVKLSAHDESELNRVIEQLKHALGEHYLNALDLSLAEWTLELARSLGVTVGFAESCTGGLLSAALTQIAGSSSVFMGSVISYSNEVKRRSLGVREDTLIAEGAVSEACASEMALGAREALEIDWAVSVTGIAGPGGGSPHKPVGTVCFGWAGPNGVEVERVHFNGDRRRVQATSVAYALLGLTRRLERQKREVSHQAEERS